MTSSLHQEVRELLKQIYPEGLIQEERTIKYGGRTLRLDFFIGYPFNVAVECQGEQHDKYVPHFHRDQEGFRESLRRDRLKDTWCYEHAVALVYVYAHESGLTVDDLRKKIEKAEREVDREWDYNDE